MKLISQRISARTLPKIMEVDDGVVDALSKLMVGLVEIFDLKASGGKEMSQTPEPLNQVRMSVRTFDKDGSTIGCAFRIPHVNPALAYKDLENLVVGKFDAYWNSDLKASDVSIIYDKVSIKSTKK
jgi:hypothetical protein